MSAPELSVQLARRALLVGATDASTGAGSGETRNLVMRAQAVLASGLVRISQHAQAVEPGFAALTLAETGGARDVAAAVRIDLAACAQQVGEPLLGGALLRPVLEAGQTPPAVRAAALGRLVGCVAHVARRDDVEDALSEADRLLAADSGIAADVRRMERARLAVRTAGYHRWYGDTEDAITAAREGLALLTRLRPDLRSESDRLRARLVLELVCGLLDEGELSEALNAAHPTVDEPVRATSAASVGRLMLAVATRVYLPSGQTDRGRHLLDQAAWVAERHALDGLRADALTEVSRLEEQAGRAADALEAMRAARAAEHRRMRAVSRAARIVLVEVGSNHGVRDTAQQSVAALMRRLAHPAGLPVAVAPPAQVEPAQQRPSGEQQTPSAAPELAGTVDMAKDNGLLDREGLIRRLRAVRTGERPVALTLVRFDSTKDGTDDRGPDTGIMAGLADKVRDMAPDNAEVARSDGSELAVLLPATTRDQAEEFAATIRESDWAAAGGKDMSISTGVVQTDHPATDENLDPTGILSAARNALTSAQAPATGSSLSETAAALQSALSEETPTRPLNQPHQPEPQSHTRQAGSPTQQAGTPSQAPRADVQSQAHHAASQGQAGSVSQAQQAAPRSQARPTEPQQPGRSILSSLSIPSGSGGRRRAGEEQPPGAKSRWPAEPAEAPRWTRAERRAQAEASQPDEALPADWPSTADEPSQGKRAATPTKPSFSESRIGEATTGIDRTRFPARHGAPHDGPDEPGLTTRRTIHPTPATSTEGPTSEPPQATPATETSPGDPHTRDEAPHRATQTHPEASHASPLTAASHPEASHASPLTAASHPEASHASPLTAASHPEASHASPVAAASQDGAGHASPFAAANEDDASLAAGPQGEASRSAEGASGSSSASPEGENSASPGSGVGAPRLSSTDDGFFSSLAGLSSGGMLRGAENAQRSSYEETKAELARMMSALNAKSQAARERNGTRQAAPAPPPPADVTEPPARPEAEPPARPEPLTQFDPGAPVRFDSDAPARLESEPPARLEPASLTRPEPGAPVRFEPEAPARFGSESQVRHGSESLIQPAPESMTRVEPETSARFEPEVLTRPEPDAPARFEPEQPVRPAPESLTEPATPASIEPEVGGRSRLMAAFDALTGPVPGLRAEFDDAPELPARKPAESWARIESSAAVESPADELFGAEPADTGAPRSSLGAAFAEFGAVEKKVTEPVKEPVQETSYDAPIGPEPRPDDLPRRGERSSATIASLLTEALAAYQSTAEDAEVHRAPERFDSFVSDDADRQQSGVRGRHRSPE
ncbi:GGDEF domain-containing protein [Actinophytocola sp. KF-1]